MPKSIQILIPQPCHEKWAAMTQVDKGRFCASCQKNVIYFTKASDREIAQAFKQNGSMCGRFRNDQLERDLIVPKEKSSLWAAASAAVISFLTLGNNEAIAQKPVSTEQIPQQNQDMSGKITTYKPFTLKGVVNDNIGPLPGATIKNIISQKEIFTDIDGNFIIEATIGDSLKISFTEYKTITIEIKNELPLSIVLEEDTSLEQPIVIEAYRTKTLTYTTGIVITVTEVIYDRQKKRSFIGRTLESIGNWFR